MLFQRVSRRRTQPYGGGVKLHLTWRAVPLRVVLASGIVVGFMPLGWTRRNTLFLAVMANATTRMVAVQCGGVKDPEQHLLAERTPTRSENKAATNMRLASSYASEQVHQTSTKYKVA